MSGFVASGFLALLGGLGVIVMGFGPYVAWSYRKYGNFGMGRALLTGCTAIYLFALWTYTILPLPDPATVCGLRIEPQLVPFQFVRETGAAITAGGSVRPILTQVLLNVVLFVPLGVVLRYLSRRGWGTVALTGLGVSLLVELTQLTGTWGMYPCAYRVFDVDDLIANTVGAVAGFFIAPAPRVRRSRHHATQPTPTTGARRILGMLVDVVLVEVATLALWPSISTALVVSGAMSRGQMAAAADWMHAMVNLVVAGVLLVGLPLLGQGATPGQRAVLLRPLTDRGTPPAVPQRLVRALTGSFGYFLLSDLGNLGPHSLSVAAVAFGVASVVVAAGGDHRGLSGIVARVRLIDTRAPLRPVTDAERWAAMPELRRLSVAVVIFSCVVHLCFLGLLDLVSVGDKAHPLALVVFAGLIGLAATGITVFLLFNGMAMVRREGRNLGNLLTLLTGLGVCGLTLVTLLALATGSRVLLATVGVAWALVAYVVFLFFAFAFYGLIYAHRTPVPGADSVIVLGARVFGSRVPPLLASRLRHGQSIFQSELDRGGDAVLVCSGGQGPGEDVAEGVAMADYLTDAGTPSALIRQETLSRTTQENLILSLKMLRAEGRGDRVVVVTNDFHAFRAAIITRELGLRAQVVGAPTASYFLPSALLREFIGVLARNVWPHLLAAVMIIAVGVALLH